MKHDRFKKRSRIFLLIFLLASFAFAVCVVEILLPYMSQGEKGKTVTRSIRLKEFPPLTTAFLTPSNKYMMGTDTLEQKEYRLAIDDDGYISPSKIHENADSTILFLGGSTTECIYVDEKARFPYLVGRLLEKDGKKVNSFNSGISGNHSLHSIDILLNKGLKLNPDVAVLMHNFNDLTILLYEKTYWNDHPSRSLLTVRKHKDIEVMNIIRGKIPNIYMKMARLKPLLNALLKRDDEFAHLRGEKYLIDREGILEKFEQNLMAFIGISRVYGVTPVLMTQASRFKEEPDDVIFKSWKPALLMGITYEEFSEVYAEMNESIRKIGRSADVLVIDLAKEVPQTNAYMYDIVHYNNFGSKYVATLIANQLMKLLNK